MRDKLTPEMELSEAHRMHADAQRNAEYLRNQLRAANERIRQLEAELAGEDDVACGYTNGVIICLNERPCPAHSNQPAPRSGT